MCKKREKYLVTIIVPVYNSEKYIEKCLSSICNQTYSNIEIIIIDDCSTDCSHKIICDYIKGDKRIKVYKNERNRGVSYTRNRALSLAEGEYITFVDSDDQIDSRYIDNLIKTQNNYPDYVSMCSLRKFYDVIDEPIQETEEIRLIDAETYLNDQYAFHPWACGTLFLKSIILKYHLQFVENAKFSEDAFFVAKYCSLFKGCAISNLEYYFYYQNPNGGAVNKTSKQFTSYDLEHRFTSKYAYQDALDFVGKHCDKKLVSCIASGYSFLIADFLLMYERIGKKNKKLQQELRSYFSFAGIRLFLKTSPNKNHKLLVVGMFVNSYIAEKILDGLIMR